MEVDMHSDPGMWRAKIAKLQSLLRHLRAVAIHVNAAITDEMLYNNIALVQQLQGVTELKLHLREGCDLPPAAAAAISAMTHLTRLSIVGGGLKPDAAANLLTGFAVNNAAAGSAEAGGGLRSLTLLPSLPYGLGDTEMAALSGCSSLEALEFRAYRLTSAGLATLSLGLPRLARLAISSLDSDSGYELACLERLAALAELDLALEAAPLGAVGRRGLMCAARPGRSLSLSFRWTDKAQGLLTEYGNRLANLTHLDVGACRVGSESLFEAVAQLTGLRELRMAVYCNADHCIPCHLSRLSALAALQRFHLEKRKAYFPEARRFGESSISVPVTAAGLTALASRWNRLRSLRLALSRSDYCPEALSVLSSFTGLRELGILVERSTATATPAIAAAGPSGGNTAASGGQQQPEQIPYGGGSSGLSRLSRRGVELPPLLDLACLPPGLHSLELNNLLLDLSDNHYPPAAAAVPSPPPLSAFDASIGILADGADVANAASAAAPLPPLPLSQLTSLDIEACVLRPPLLERVAQRCGGGLRRLRLAGVVGLSDEVLAAALPVLSGLRALAVCAPGNRAVSQAGLAALASPTAAAPAAAVTCGGGGFSPSAAPRPPQPQPQPRLRPLPPQPRAGVLVLRQLSWESNDLTSRGPDLAALAPLTCLRHLYLSCTDKTAERALGGSLEVLQDTLPYCRVDMVWTSPRPGEGAP